MQDHDCIQRDNIAAILKRVATIDRALFFGNGHPSLVTQIATITLQLRAINWGIRLLATTIIVQLVGLALWFLKQQ